MSTEIGYGPKGYVKKKQNRGRATPNKSSPVKKEKIVKKKPLTLKEKVHANYVAYFEGRGKLIIDAAKENGVSDDKALWIAAHTIAEVGMKANASTIGSNNLLNIVTYNAKEGTEKLVVEYDKSGQAYTTKRYFKNFKSAKECVAYYLNSVPGTHFSKAHDALTTDTGTVADFADGCAQGDKRGVEPKTKKDLFYQFGTDPQYASKLTSSINTFQTQYKQYQEELAKKALDKAKAEGPGIASKAAGNAQPPTPNP